MTLRDVPVVVRDRRGWFTSSYSNDSMSCVEVRFDQDVVLVRDSKDKRRQRPVIGVSGPGWTSFLEAIR